MKSAISTIPKAENQFVIERVPAKKEASAFHRTPELLGTA